MNTDSVHLEGVSHIDPPRAEAGLRALFRLEVVGLCLAALFLVAGAGAAWMAAVPAEVFKARLDALSPDGSATTFPLARTLGIQQRSGVLGACLLATGLLLLARLRPWTAGMRRRAGEVTTLLREGCADVRAWWTNETGHALALLALALAAVVLRLLFLGQDMRYDEADSYLMFASRSLLYGLSDYPEPNNHLLNTLLMHVSVQLFGDAPWALRLPALIAGVLVVPAAYWALRGWVGRWPALVAAGLCGGSSFLVHYSVNARGYAFVVLAFCCGLGLCKRLALRPDRGAAVLLGLVSALGFYAVPTMLLPFGTCLLWLGCMAILERRDGRALDRLGDVLVAGSVAVGLTLLAYAPVILVSGPKALTGNKYLSASTWTEWSERLVERLAVFGAEMGRPPGLALVLVLGLTVWVVVDLGRGARSVGLLAALLVWSALILLVQRAPPFGRVWTFVMPLTYGLGAAGLVWLVKRVRDRPAPLALLVVVTSAWMGWDTLRSRSPSLSPEGERFEAAQEVADFLQGVLAPEDRIVALSPVRTPLWYYLRRNGLPAQVMSHDPDGSRPFTYAVVNLPLAQFNAGLRDWKLPALEPSRLRLLREFRGATVYRLDPPLAH